MGLKHLVILLKAEGQRPSASQKQRSWEEIDLKIGKWIEENGENAKKILAALWKGDCGKIPVLYGKQGKLSMIPLQKIKENQNISFIPKHLSVIENRHFDLFSKTVSPEEIVDFYQSDIDKMIVFTEKIQEKIWTFSEEKALNDLELFLSEHEDKVKKMSAWHKNNQPKNLQSFLSNLQKDKEIINHYHSHIFNCKKSGFHLKILQDDTVICGDCKSKWSYQRSLKKFLLKTDFTSTLKTLSSFVSHKEKRQIEEKTLKEEIKNLQKEINHIDFEEIENIQNDISKLINIVKKEEFEHSKLLNLKHEMEPFIQIKKVLHYQLDLDLYQSYAFSEINSLLSKAKTISSIPTSQQFKEILDGWKEQIGKQTRNFEEYQKNIVKHLPSVYELSGFSLSLKEVKEILLFIQSIDGDFGYHLIADTLKGSKQKKVVEFKLNKKSQYALLSRFKKDDILDIIHAIAKRGWIVQRGNDYPKIHLTENGKKQLQRLIQKESLLTDDMEIIEIEKKRFMKQSFKQFIGSFDNVLFEDSWRSLYLNNHYKEKGITFYKELLQFYKDSKINYAVIDEFIKETFDDKYKPIFLFYQKTAKNESFIKVIENLI